MPVLVIQEDALPCIAQGGDVVEGPWDIRYAASAPLNVRYHTDIHNTMAKEGRAIQQSPS